MLKVRSGKSGLFIFGQELASFALIACALFLCVSLCTYDPHDNSLFYFTNASSQTHNMGGVVGAHIAALCFYLLGSSCVGIVGLLLFLAYLVLTGISYGREWERLSAIFVVVLVSATLCNVYKVDFLRSPYAGGLLGNMLHKHLIAAFGMLGAHIFLHTLLMMCLMLLIRFSFMNQLQYVMHGISVVFSKRFFVPLYRFVSAVIKMCVLLFKKAACFLTDIYKGSVLSDDYYSVIDFEQALLMSADEIIRDNGIQQQIMIKQDIVCDKQSQGAGRDALQQHIELQVSEDLNVQESVPRKLDEPEIHYKLPHSLLFAQVQHDTSDVRLSKELETRAKILEEKLERFGVSGTVVSIKRGPVVTLFEYQPNIDTKVSKIVALEDDLALALQALSIRIIAPIPGRSVVGFEVANKLRKDVLFATVARSSAYEDFKGSLPLILGEDTIGNNVVVDLARMPHLLIAGSTGSGKSVALNAMLISLLCKLKPTDLKLILIDPKRLEFACYADIPHLLFPIITESKRATLALRWVVKQMEDRYEMMAACGARNIHDYNAMVGAHPLVSTSMPFIVVIIDELADLMMTASRDIEDLIARVAQMARAAGIHMLVATQRPSVDVITGLIKVNFPSRISFRVTSKIDSRTILDCGGADKLLGRGDMLFLDAGTSTLCRVHGAYVSDKEIADIVAHIRAQQMPSYLDLTTEIMHAKRDVIDDEDDQLYNDIILFLKEIDEVSISLLQRKFRIGFNRSARIIEQLESQGLIMSVDGGKTRKVIR